MRVLPPNFFRPSLCKSKSSLCYYSPSSSLGVEGENHFSRCLDPVPVLDEKKLSDGKIDVEKPRLDDGDSFKVVLRSSLKKPLGRCSEKHSKGRVKWNDSFGKELVEVREFVST